MFIQSEKKDNRYEKMGRRKVILWDLLFSSIIDILEKKTSTVKNWVKKSMQFQMIDSLIFAFVMINSKHGHS